MLINQCEIKKNIENLRFLIPKSVQLIAVSKTFNCECIQIAYDAGQRDFGENKVQELRKKAEILKDLPGIRWHFIGHLQSNKVNTLLNVPNLYMIHSLDRLKVLLQVNRVCIKRRMKLKVLIQVNTSGEASKFGCKPSDLIPLISEKSLCSGLFVCGLMTIGLLGAERGVNELCFSRLKELKVKINTSNILENKLEHLSMGMTSDYKVAINEGSTMVRVGQAIFGKRQLPDDHYWPE